jgi:hypothetical protein
MWVHVVLHGLSSPENAVRLAVNMVFSGYDDVRRVARREGLARVISAIITGTKAQKVRSGVWILRHTRTRRNALVLDLRDPLAPVIREPQRGDQPEWFSAPLVAIERHFTPRVQSPSRHPNEGAYRVIALQPGGGSWILTRCTTKEQALVWAARTGQDRKLPYQIA